MADQVNWLGFAAEKNREQQENNPVTTFTKGFLAGQTIAANRQRQQFNAIRLQQAQAAQNALQAYAQGNIGAAFKASPQTAMGLTKQQQDVVNGVLTAWDSAKFGMTRQNYPQFRQGIINTYGPMIPNITSQFPDPSEFTTDQQFNDWKVQKEQMAAQIKAMPNFYQEKRLELEQQKVNKMGQMTPAEEARLKQGEARIAQGEEGLRIKRKAEERKAQGIPTYQEWCKQMAKEDPNFLKWHESRKIQTYNSLYTKPAQPSTSTKYDPITGPVTTVRTPGANPPATPPPAPPPPAPAESSWLSHLFGGGATPAPAPAGGVPPPPAPAGGTPPPPAPAGGATPAPAPAGGQYFLFQNGVRSPVTKEVYDKYWRYYGRQ